MCFSVHWMSGRDSGERNFVSFIGADLDGMARGIRYQPFVFIWALFKASRDSCGSEDVWFQTINVMVSALTNPARTCEFELRFMNLSLMGLVLCMFVYHTRTIWVAVGTHAGWVWMEKLNRLLTDHAHPVDSSMWMGHRADMTDSLTAVGMCCVLAICGSLWLPVRGRIENSGEAR